MNILLLGSQSVTRQRILKECNIPFTVIGHKADESKCDWGLPLQKLLETIAVYKMEHALLPDGKEGDSAYVLTVDTMPQDSNGNVYGKPKKRTDALAMIKALQENGTVGTAFVCDKKIYRNGTWQVEKRIVDFAQASYCLEIPNPWLERYLTECHDFMKISGAVDITGYGAQFLKSVDGSYGAALSLPMNQVRDALIKVGFFD